ncbi:hypothetical protein UM91_22040 [Pseudomonas oryzihabitans]|uniref:hypothetical protein n=1 Tax=Pseudomonas oryzihabitans TaxID=47885 RepID=UPI0005CB2199|nr:hypothetical protein [Pseudomonas oryzihabitans]KIZ48460.1 hypothetical protein UM91_22040 [Pseudomonas oryzihabitans]
MSPARPGPWANLQGNAGGAGQALVIDLQPRGAGGLVCPGTPVASPWSWICSGLDVDGQAGALGELQGDAAAAGQVLVIVLQHRGAGGRVCPGTPLASTWSRICSGLDVAGPAGALGEPAGQCRRRWPAG